MFDFQDQWWKNFYDRKKNSTLCAVFDFKINGGKGFIIAEKVVHYVLFEQLLLYMLEL